MAIVIRLHHNRHFDLLRDADISDGVERTGTTFDVETRDGTETRERVAVAVPGGVTTVELPDDYDASPQALLHLVQTITERHSAEDDVFAISGQNDNIVARLAALMNAEVQPFEDVVTATETTEPIPAPGQEA